MAQLMHLDRRKVLIFSVLLFLFVSVCFSVCSESQVEGRGLSSRSGSRRRLLEAEEEWEEKPLKKKTPTQSTKNETKLIKPNTLSSKNQTKTLQSGGISTKNQTKTIKSNTVSTKNQTKTVKPSNISTKNQTKTIKSDNLSSKNQTKIVKVSSNSSSKTTPTDSGLKKKLNSTTSASKNKLNSTTSSTSKIKKLNSTSKASTTTSSKSSSPSISSKKPLDLAKSSNKTAKATATKDKDKDRDKNKQTKTTTKVADQTHEPEKPSKKPQKSTPNQQQQQHIKKPTKQAPPSYWMDEEEDDDLVSEIKDLPNKFHQTLIPDLERISTTSKLYITKANNEMTKGFKPYVGKKYAPTVAAIISCAFILIPLLLVSLLCTRIKAYFSLQKIIIFIQVYLSIYFTILCISSLVTGLEPLKFLYSTSQSTYLCLQVLQTLAYVFYLLMLLMYLVFVFSTECGLGSKFLGLAQTFVGFAVGLHHYVTVFHRVVLRQPPKTNWKVHGVYATCFLLICVLSRADRRKKVYVEDGGGEGKQN